MFSNLEALIQNSNNILLLQGPIGPFFHRFANFLSTKHHKNIFKINLNAGDRHFYPENQTRLPAISYRGSVDDFDAFLADFVRQHHIDTIICFGDTRIYHRKARALCQQQADSLTFWVFEEGYFRPHYITLERDGVNDYSPEPREPSFYLDDPLQQIIPDPPEPKPMGPRLMALEIHATVYYVVMNLYRQQYPLYHHHRVSDLCSYTVSWLKKHWIKVCHVLQEKRLAAQIKQGQMGTFYVVPLQVHSDSQIRVHSQFKSVAFFIRYVIRSFVTFAPPNTKLIIKHHPVDRGSVDYARLIAKLKKHYQAQQHAANKEIIYIYDIPLPILLRKARGVVTINSTSGLSAMIHHLPVKVLGAAHYNISGLINEQSLADFWRQPSAPNDILFQRFRHYHLYKTQINGNFYSGRMIDFEQ